VELFVLNDVSNISVSVLIHSFISIIIAIAVVIVIILIPLKHFEPHCHPHFGDPVFLSSLLGRYFVNPPVLSFTVSGFQASNQSNPPLFLFLIFPMLKCLGSCKALRYDSKGVSCCPPAMYAERFNQFMKNAIV